MSNIEIPDGPYAPPAEGEEVERQTYGSPTGSQIPQDDQESLNQAARFEFATDDFEPGDMVGDARAVRLVVQRFSKMGLKRAGANINDWRRSQANLAMKIIAMIPDEMQTQDMLKNGDLRPLLNAVGEADRGNISPDQKTEVAGLEFSNLELAMAREAVVVEHQRVTDQLTKDMLGGIPQGQLDEEGLATLNAFVENMANEWRGGRVNRLDDVDGKLRFNGVTEKWEVVDKEEADELDLEGNSTNALDQFLDDGGFDAGSTEQTESLIRFMSAADIRSLVQSGELTLDDINDFETGEEVGIDGQVVDNASRARVQYMGGESTSSLIRGGPDPRLESTGVLSDKGEDNARWGDKENYSIREVRRLHHDMTQEEKLALTDKMKKAGLFDLVGQEPVIPGDTTDPAFKAAWEHLIKMGVETGKPMNELLQERMTAFDIEKEASLSTKLTDPARLRINGNGYARDVIGRHLTDEEQSKMIEFMHNLERENAKINEGLTTDDPETQLDEAVVADIDARMQEWMRDGTDQLGIEAGAKDQADQYEEFTRMLAGPGRGVR